MSKLKEYVEQLLQDCDDQYKSWLSKSEREMSESPFGLYESDLDNRQDESTSEDPSEPLYVQG